jgi:hypothetical protein
LQIEIFLPHTAYKRTIMRTKTLVLSAALSLACVATSMAQVFSANIVGYYNRTVPAGQLALLANQLKGTNTNIGAVLSGSNDGDKIFTWNGTGWVVNTFIGGFGWDPDPTVAPGTGFFYKNSGASAVTLTFVGEVPTGSLTNNLTTGLSLKGAVVPQAGDLDAIHSLQGADGDRVYKWTGTGWDANSPTYIGGFGWDPTATVVVGEGFFYKNTAASTKVWVRVFNP